MCEVRQGSQATWVQDACDLLETVLHFEVYSMWTRTKHMCVAWAGAEVGTMLSLAWVQLFLEDARWEIVVEEKSKWVCRFKVKLVLFMGQGVLR